MPTSMIRSSAIYPAPIIWILNANNPRLPDGQEGTAYAFGLGAFGGALPYTWNVVSNTGVNTWTIPAGVLTCANPVRAEIDYVTVQVTDATGNNIATTTLEVVIITNLAMAAGTLPNATQGSAYSTSVAGFASGGTPPYVFSLFSQTGVNGFSVSAAGLITGTPGTAETDSITVLCTDSDVPAATASQVYSVLVMALAATPTFVPGTGTYTQLQLVRISTTTPSATIYYTTDGSPPTTSSAVYSSPVVVSASGTTTIKAIATAAGFAQSLVGTATYIINVQQAATPTFSPPGGTYTSTRSVTISDTTPGASIYYTTDGTVPGVLIDNAGRSLSDSTGNLVTTSS